MKETTHARGGKLMRKQRFVIGMVLGIGLAVAVGSVEAKDKEFHAQFAGLDINKDDFSFTGTSGVAYINVAGQSTLGTYTAQAVSDFEPDNKTCTPPDGGNGAELAGVAEFFILSFTATGEQLFMNLSPVGQVGCFNTDTGVGTGQFTFAVSGGTGRFAGATGTIVKTVKVIVLAPPDSPSSRGYFDSFTGTFDGTIEFAE
jgi:hypothetical protein